jgi:hypothetical protein
MSPLLFAVDVFFLDTLLHPTPFLLPRLAFFILLSTHPFFILRYPVLEDYVDVAFTTARASDPKALLCYNDYTNEGMSGKSDYIYGMVESMLNRGNA